MEAKDPSSGGRAKEEDEVPGIGFMEGMLHDDGAEERFHEAVETRLDAPADPLVDGGDGGEDAAEDETRSHFSDSSSEGDVRSPEHAPQESTKDSNSNEAATGNEHTTVDETLPSVPPTTDPTPNLQQPTPEAEDSDYPYQMDDRPWLHNAGHNGALLPIGVRDDDLFPRKAPFYHHDHAEPFYRSHRTHYPSPTPAPMTPSLMTDAGVLERMRVNRNALRQQRNQLIARLRDAGEVVRDAEEERRMLLGTIDTKDEALRRVGEENVVLRDEATRTKEEVVRNLGAARESLEGWKRRSAQWERAFEKQKPLAQAERERRMLREAGVEERVDAQTQTSPKGMVDGVVQTEESEDVASAVEAVDMEVQTDGVVVDFVDYEDIAQQRDALVIERDQILDEAGRLKKVLQETKDWIESNEMVPKVPTQDASVQTLEPAEAAADLAKPGVLPEAAEEVFVETEVPEGGDVAIEEEKPTASPASAPSSAEGDAASTTPSPARPPPALPPNPINASRIPDLPLADLPDRWREREEKMRSSNAWRMAKQEVAAALNLWEKELQQVYADAAARAAAEAQPSWVEVEVEVQG